MQFYIRTVTAEKLRGLRAKLEAGVKLVENEITAKKPRKELTAAERERLKLEIENTGVGAEEPGGNLCYSDSDTIRNRTSSSNTEIGRAKTDEAIVISFDESGVHKGQSAEKYNILKYTDV